MVAAGLPPGNKIAAEVSRLPTGFLCTIGQTRIIGTYCLHLQRSSSNRTETLALRVAPLTRREELLEASFENNELPVFLRLVSSTMQSSLKQHT